MKVVTKVESPCISVCKLNKKTGFCEGCWRTGEEIKLWRGSGPDDRMKILQACHKRRLSAGHKSRRQTRRMKNGN